MKVKITDTDHGWAAMLKTIQSTKLLNVSVGIQEEAGAQAKTVRTKDGIKTTSATLAAVAMYHEFGLGVPERSFIRGWYDENEDEIKAFIYALAKRVVEGELTQDTALRLLGTSFRDHIKQRIRANIPPPLARETVKRKGHEIALIDTEQLINEIDYKLEA